MMKKRNKNRVILMGENSMAALKNTAGMSLLFGLASVVSTFIGDLVLVPVILGIVGLVFAGKAKAEGHIGGVRTAGYILSWVGLGIGLVGVISYFLFVELF